MFQNNLHFSLQAGGNEVKSRLSADSSAALRNQTALFLGSIRLLGNRPEDTNKTNKLETKKKKN